MLFRSHIGYLPQDVELLDGSISENIARFGTIDPEQVVAAAQAAGVHDMILRLPEGYETRIIGQGKMLSAGQQQRIVQEVREPGVERGEFVVRAVGPGVGLRAIGEEGPRQRLRALQPVVRERQRYRARGGDRGMVREAGAILRDRATRIVRELTGCDTDAARAALEKSRWVVKDALRLVKTRR